MEDGGLRILLVSDSHGDLEALAAAVDHARNRVDMAIFLGDGAADLDGLAAKGVASPPWTAVRGNTDAASRLPEALMLETAVGRILLTHGHRQGVQHGLGGLAAAARLSGASMAFFGHTHRPCLGGLGGVKLVNPGSLSRPRGPEEGSFVILSIGPSGSMDAEFLCLRPAGRGYRIREAPEGFASAPSS